MNEIQVHKLLKKKKSLNKKDLEELNILIAKLSLRSETLSSKKIGTLVKNFNPKFPSLGPIDDLTLREILEFGALHITALPSVGKKRIKKLNEFLNQILEGSIELEIASSEEILSVSLPKPNKVKTVRRKLVSINVEKKLVEAIGELKTSQKFNLIKDKKLQEFWGEFDVQAPFEQVLTFSQIVSMDISMILRKRSMNEKKVNAIIAAIKRGIKNESQISSSEVVINSNEDNPQPFIDFVAKNENNESSKKIENLQLQNKIEFDKGSKIVLELANDSLLNEYQHLKNPILSDVLNIMKSVSQEIFIKEYAYFFEKRNINSDASEVIIKRYLESNNTSTKLFLDTVLLPFGVNFNLFLNLLGFRKSLASRVIGFYIIKSYGAVPLYPELLIDGIWTKNRNLLIKYIEDYMNKGELELAILKQLIPGITDTEIFHGQN